MTNWPTLIAIGSVVIAACVLLDRLTIPERGVIWLRVRYLADAAVNWQFRHWHRSVAVVGLRFIRWTTGDARSLRKKLVTVTSLSACVTMLACMFGLIRQHDLGWFDTSRISATIVVISFIILSGIWRSGWFIPSIALFGITGFIVFSIFWGPGRPVAVFGRLFGIFALNLLLDVLTVGATWLILGRVMRCGAIAATVLFALDVVVALLLAFACFVLFDVLNSWAWNLRIWTPGESLAEALKQLGVSLTTLRAERDLLGFHFSSTTLVPTALYCLVGVVLCLTKIGASATRWVTIRLAGAVANPENPSDTRPFTVLALLVAVVVALAKAMHQLAQLAVANSP